MAIYIALLRGISPTNPNMRNDKLRGVFESLGFQNVTTVISSGNVIFEAPGNDTKELESSIEKAIKDQLGFFSMTVVLKQQQLQKLVALNPFNSRQHSRETYLIVTFFKDRPKPKFKFPYSPEGKTYILLGLFDNAICSVVDVTTSKTPDFMSWIEKEFGKSVTTRTWKTIHRILARTVEVHNNSKY